MRYRIIREYSYHKTMSIGGQSCWRGSGFEEMAGSLDRDPNQVIIVVLVFELGGDPG